MILELTKSRQGVLSTLVDQKMAHSSLIRSLFKALVHSNLPLRRLWVINDVHSFCAMPWVKVSDLSWIPSSSQHTYFINLWSYFASKMMEASISTQSYHHPTAWKVNFKERYPKKCTWSWNSVVTRNSLGRRLLRLRIIQSRRKKKTHLKPTYLVDPI